jgi:ACS family allantoate permease-like MFS transporter
MAWGAVLAIFAVVKNFAGAMAIRFLLGLFEAASMPGFALLSSQWYTVKEHNTRTGFYIGAGGVGQIVGGLVAYGIARGLHGSTSTLAGWKVIFIATGCFTVGLCLGYFCEGLV